MQYTSFKVIKTKYLSPTNFRGARIKASSEDFDVSIIRARNFSVDIMIDEYSVARELVDIINKTYDQSLILLGDVIANKNEYLWIIKYE